jgi:hypothetical protein
MEGMITEGLLYLVVPYNYLLFSRLSMKNIIEVKIVLIWKHKLVCIGVAELIRNIEQ